MIQIDEDDEFNRNDKKFVSSIEMTKKIVKMKMISSIKIYELTKSVILVKSTIYKVNKVSSIVIRSTSIFFFFKKHKTHKTHKNTQKYTLKTKQELYF